MNKNVLIKKLQERTVFTELERIDISKEKLMFLKNQNNISDIVFINAVLDKYKEIVELIEK